MVTGEDGYAITLVTDSKDWTSHCLVFDATDIAKGPVARVRLPQRVPFGFHATWARGEELYPARELPHSAGVRARA